MICCTMSRLFMLYKKLLHYESFLPKSNVSLKEHFQNISSRKAKNFADSRQSTCTIELLLQDGLPSSFSQKSSFPKLYFYFFTASGRAVAKEGCFFILEHFDTLFSYLVNAKELEVKDMIPVLRQSILGILWIFFLIYLLSSHLCIELPSLQELFAALPHE